MCAGVGYEYKFVNRQDCPLCLSNASYQARTYSVMGSTNLDTSHADWNILNTSPPETRPWNYLSAPPTNGFRFFRVLEQPVPYWPN